MDESLLAYYQKELAFVRQAGNEFAKAYPTIAAHLKLDERGGEDPHIARLIEAFAFMNARIHHKLEDDFPELAEALLDHLGPHYQRPFPAMVIGQFQPRPDLDKAYLIPRHTKLEAFSSQDVRYNFHTCFDTTVLPIEIEAANLYSHREFAPALPKGLQASSCLHLILSCLDEEMNFADLAPSKLRFFLKGQPQTTHALYDLLFKHAKAIAISNPAQHQNTLFLKPEQLEAVGFDADETILPYSAQTPPGHRLLTEYFVYPKKFMFVDLKFTQGDTLRHIGRRMEICIYFDRDPLVLQKLISTDSFALGCTPIVNLFKRQAEPINLNHTRTDYPVIADSRATSDNEVYSIDQVTAIDSEKGIMPVLPFNGVNHNDTMLNPGMFWHSRRQVVHERSGETRLFISPVDLKLNPASAAETILQLNVTCFNRDLTRQLFFDEHTIAFQLPTLTAPVQKIICINNPDPVIKAQLGSGNRWRLISQLLLNHTGILLDDRSPAVLQEVLRLHNFNASSETEKLIASLKSLQSRFSVAQVVVQGMATYIHGLELSLDIDEANMIGSSVYLFLSVIEQFLSLTTSLNSFTQLVVTTQSGSRLWHRWPPRTGQQNII